MTEKLQIWDPHFHIWDVSPATKSGHDEKVLFAPNGNPVYTPELYQQDISATGGGFTHIGGTFLETVSICHVHKTGPELSADCLAEASWASQQLRGSDKQYVLVPSVPLEAPDVVTTLAELAKDGSVRGVRQILNFEPSWPRNDKSGDLLDQPQWQKGFAELQNFSFSFDLQLNPHQYQKAAALIQKHPEVPVIINHLGTPTLEDLQGKAAQYWQGIEALAACRNTFMKISMLAYTDPAWDQNETVINAVYRVIETFGIKRCFFASNLPVEARRGWPAERLYPAFLKLAAAKFTRQDQQKLFSENAMSVYRANRVE